MKRNDVYFEWLYDWVILIILMIIVVLIYYGLFTPEQFNPDLHDCMGWENNLRERHCDRIDGEGVCWVNTVEVSGVDYPFEDAITSPGWLQIISKENRGSSQFGYECVSWQPKKQKRSEQKPTPETTSSLTIELINSSEGDTTGSFGVVQVFPCECCKTNTCPNLSNPKDLEELNVQQCGYAYHDYINQSVSESQRERAKQWLIDECNGVFNRLPTVVKR